MTTTTIPKSGAPPSSVRTFMENGQKMIELDEDSDDSGSINVADLAEILEISDDEDKVKAGNRA